jgi:hypothetical protein
MVGPISSATSTQTVTPSAAAPNKESNQSQPAANGEDSVHLSSAAQSKIAESHSGCSGH